MNYSSTGPLETLLMLMIDRSAMSDHRLAILRYTYKDNDNEKMDAMNNEYFEEVNSYGNYPSSYYCYVGQCRSIDLDSYQYS